MDGPAVEADGEADGEAEGVIVEADGEAEGANVGCGVSTSGVCAAVVNTMPSRLIHVRDPGAILAHLIFPSASTTTWTPFSWLDWRNTSVFAGRHAEGSVAMTAVLFS